METFTMGHFLVCAIFVALVVPIHAKPMTLNPEDERKGMVPVDLDGDDGGEIMDVANARYYYPGYYYMPYYRVRRVQSNRRRVYAPRRSHSDDGYTFPAIT